MNEQMGIGLAVGVIGTLAVVVVGLIVKAGSVGKAMWGLTVGGRANADADFEKRVNEMLGTATASPKPAVPTGPPKPSGEPLRLLTLLQTEARLLDFLMEDISGAGDAQVGSAVRDIHRKAQAALKQHLTLGPAMAGTEGDRVTVPAGFDPSAIRVVGNVTGQPPFTGELLHAGWKVTELKLPPTPLGQDLFVVQPAEVQL